MFRLLIVDDEYYVRVGIKSAIDWSEIGVEVVGEAADGEEALEMALSSRPDIIHIIINIWVVIFPSLNHLHPHHLHFITFLHRRLLLLRAPKV